MSRYTIKHWTGAPGERFTYEDLNRLIDIAKDLDRRNNGSGEDGYFQRIHYATHESQIESFVMSNLENAIGSLSESHGVRRHEVQAWWVGRIISYKDIESMEQTLEYLDTVFPN